MTKGKPSTLIDIASLDTKEASNKGADIELLAPVSNAKTGMFISLLGKDSDTFIEHTRNAANERIRKAHMAQKSGKDSEIPTAEAAEEKALELLALCTTGWYQVYEEGGETKKEASLFYKGEWLPFNINNALRLYREQLWIRRQVDTEIGALENFMKA